MNLKNTLGFDKNSLNLQYVLEILKDFDMILFAYVNKWRNLNKNNDFPGLYISETEMDSILSKEKPSSNNLSLTEDFVEKIKKKTEKYLQNGAELKIELLRELFNLSFFEINAIIISLAPEIDLKYEKIYGYIQDDITRKKPSIDLILKLLCKTEMEKINARKYFRQDSPLIKNLILHIDESDIPLIERGIKLDDRIVDFILGSDIMDSKIDCFASVVNPIKTFEDVTLPKSIKNQLIKLTELDLNFIPLFLLVGSNETLESAEAFCNKKGIPILITDLEKIDNDNFEANIRILFREAKLQRGAVYLNRFDAVEEKKEIIILKQVEESDSIVFIPTKKELTLKKKTIKIEIPNHSFTSRKEIWESLLGEFQGTDDLATKFRFGKSKIVAAIESARNRAFLRNPVDPSLMLDDLYSGCKAQSGTIPFTLKIIPRYTWDDIVLPEDKKEQLKEICNYVKYYPVVYERWGFEKHTLGKGLNAMFSGPSGTGKTMAAEIIASDLKLDIYKIDLSMVVSKYIGETEKNLNKIFKDAEESNAILFFDEADALFGKRSEVKDAHDRYANVEINYLLQKMEEHEGIVILATNLRKNVDDSFVRRMHSIVDFPFPNEEYRLEIWKKIFPKETLLGNLDFTFFSKLKLSGGDIKNIALAAAFQAAENSKKIQIKHIIKAAKREFQKKGRVYGKEEFGKYYDFVK